MSGLVCASTAPERAEWVPTEIDRAAATMVIRGTWLFEGGLDADRLRQGLSEVLVHYPHLAGRMHKGKRVVLTNEGVPFATATRPDLCLSSLTGDHSLAHGLAPVLRPGRIKRGVQAPMAVQLTEVADGQVLSVSCFHGCLDGHSFYDLVRRWAERTAGRPASPPLLDPSILPAPARTGPEARQAALEDGWYTPWSLVRGAPALVGIMLHGMNARVGPLLLTDEDLDRLKRTAAQESGREDLGTNDVLTAHLSLMVARLHGHRPGTPCDQVVVIDGRRRVEGVPQDYAGNCSLGPCGATFEPDATLGEVASATHDTLSPWLSVPSSRCTERLRLTRELVTGGKFLIPFDVGRMHAWRPTLVYLNNQLRLPVYEVDFGGEGAPVRPCRVIPHDLPDPVLFWPTPPDDGGLEVYLTGRPALAARRLAQDDPWWAALRGR